MQQQNIGVQPWNTEQLTEIDSRGVTPLEFDSGPSPSSIPEPIRCEKAEYLASNCLVFTYFQCSVEEEVTRHFNRSLSIPSSFCSAVALSKESESNATGEIEIIPMSHRSLPASFWRPEAGQQRARSPYDLNMQARKYLPAQPCQPSRVVKVQRFPHNYGQVPYGQPVWVQQPQHDLFPRSPVMPLAGVSSYHPSVGNCTVSTGIQVPENSVPGAMIREEPTVGRGFNPRFNSLLVHPTIKPGLPAVPGQPDLSRIDWKEVINVQQMTSSLPQHGEKTFYVI